MTNKPRKPARKLRVLKARPLLLAVGAAAIIAGCDDDTTQVSNYDMGLVPVHDMARPNVSDFGKPPTD